MRHELRASAAGLSAIALLILSACEGGDAPQGEPPIDTAAAVGAAPVQGEPITVADAGFQTPESVLHDAAADVYLVSNINGDPLGRDDNGFISRLAPDGQVQQLKWIDGASQEVTLNAPKGLALRGDTLFVADIDTVRAFDRNTGRPLGARGVAGTTFLNDLAVGPDGTLYVTDSGFQEGFQPSGTDAVYRFEGDRAVQVAAGESLRHPNGIIATSEGLVIVPFGGNAVLRVPSGGGTPTEIATLPAGQLDGIVRLRDRVFLVSSWQGEAVYRLGADGQAQAVVENVQSPADLGLDEQRRRVLIPLFQQNRVEIRPVR